MTDDEILLAAERIRRRRKNEARLGSLDNARGLMIRWDNPGAPFGESYTSVAVSADDVREIVQRVLGAAIAADASRKPVA